jgi:hypothetical protein
VGVTVDIDLLSAAWPMVSSGAPRFRLQADLQVVLPMIFLNSDTVWAAR